MTDPRLENAEQGIKCLKERLAKQDALIGELVEALKELTLTYGHPAGLVERVYKPVVKANAALNKAAAAGYGKGEG